ncbi:hypothetical protein LQ327_02530 [Actinomycetospora endophytica]|uniref:Mutator family transposase n=1 Tax=Actinomycetospora endophytica TaxID=2291215 RepID=A0ABS8P1Y8_9PSEU|nr:hypothetical protein [Actinomycetospora endophytica]MCD2192271.1 hypothetical protein [Actinomycetospora endophytica]
MTLGSTTTAAPDDVTLRTETEERLVARYVEHGVEADTVRGAVAEAWDRLGGARIRTFLPILVERSVRLRLFGTA